MGTGSQHDGHRGGRRPEEGLRGLSVLGLSGQGGKGEPATRLQPWSGQGDRVVLAAERGLDPVCHEHCEHYTHVCICNLHSEMHRH